MSHRVTQCVCLSNRPMKNFHMTSATLIISLFGQNITIRKNINIFSETIGAVISDEFLVGRAIFERVSRRNVNGNW